MLKNKNFILESEEVPLNFKDEDSANVFYYIGRLINNKGPQTKKAIEKYLNSKFDNNIPKVNVGHESFDWDIFLQMMCFVSGTGNQSKYRIR